MEKLVEKSRSNINVMGWLILVIIVILSTSCGMMGNIKEYQDTTQEFTETLLAEDYEKCMDYLVQEEGLDQGEIKEKLMRLREYLFSNYGEDLNYSLVSAKQNKISLTSGNFDTNPNQTVMKVKVSNEQNYFIYDIIFDDDSKKIKTLNVVGV